MTYEEAIKACAVDPYQCGYAWRLHYYYVVADRAWVIIVVNPGYNGFRPLYVIKGKETSADAVLNELNNYNSYSDLVTMSDIHRGADNWLAGSVQQLVSYVVGRQFL